MNGWKRNGFRTANGTDVKNKEDIVKLYNLCQMIDVKWVWKAILISSHYCLLSIALQVTKKNKAGIFQGV